MLKTFGFFILFLIAGFIAFSTMLPTYRYDPDTGHWERVVVDATVDIKTTAVDITKNIAVNSNATSSIDEPKSYSGNSNTSIPLENSIKTIPVPLFSKGQWYYYITYVVNSADVTNKKEATLWAGQSIDCGKVYVWNDSEYIYVKYVTSGQWLITETHVKVQTDEPEGNQSPGQFPYKTEYQEPVNEALYMIPLSATFKTAEKVYILAHAVVYQPNSRGSEETAWAGGQSNCMEIKVSGSKVVWFVKKPGKYFSSVLEMSIEADLPVVVTFSSFSNPKTNDSETLDAMYSITENNSPQIWLSSEDLNNLQLDLTVFPEKLYLWQMIIVNGRSSDVYRSEGVITFTLRNVRNYDEIP